MDPRNDEEVLELFAGISDEAARVVAATTEWGPSGRRAGQYAVDLAVDDVCVPPLLDAGFTVLSEESGLQEAGGAGRDAIVVVDPLDGSTNASLGLPWCATAMCLVLDGEPAVAMVTNLRTGERYHAVRGGGARRDGRPIRVAGGVELDEAIVAVNGLVPRHWGWRQYRAMGATALDIAVVARGGFDAYVDLDDDAIAVWDYLAAVLVLEEAGGVAADARGRDLMVLDPSARRTPLAATSQSLLERLLDERRR